MGSHSWVRTAVAVAVASLAFAAAPALASASTLYVSPTGTAGAANHDCSTAAYTTVGSAIAAANSGDAVYLCGTTPYRESVVIQKQVTLTGDSGAAIQAPANAAAPTTFFSGAGLQTPNSIVTVIGNYNVHITGLTIEGPFSNPPNDCASGGGTPDYGILQINGGQLLLNNDDVSNIAASDPTDANCDYGVGVQLGSRSWPTTSGGSSVVNFVGNAQIQQGTAVSGYQQAGIVADGPGTQVQVQQTTVTGSGPDSNLAQVGVQVSEGATGHVQNSAVSNNEFTGTGSTTVTRGTLGPRGRNPAVGVLVSGGCGAPLSTNVQVHDNTLVNNDAGVGVAEFDPTCSTSPSTQTDSQIHNDVIKKLDGQTSVVQWTDQFNNSYSGLQVGVVDTGNGDQIHNNKISGTIGPNGNDIAYGPQTSPGGAFLYPIDTESYPPLGAQVHNNIYDGTNWNPGTFYCDPTTSCDAFLTAADGTADADVQTPSPGSGTGSITLTFQPLPDPGLPCRTAGTGDSWVYAVTNVGSGLETIMADAFGSAADTAEQQHPADSNPFFCYGQPAEWTQSDGTPAPAFHGLFAGSLPACHFNDLATDTVNTASSPVTNAPCFTNVFFSSGITIDARTKQTADVTSANDDYSYEVIAPDQSGEPRSGP